jgi:hypothetical protein
MAPQKKSKKDANSINSKLALVMKSGKGTLPSNSAQMNSQTLWLWANDDIEYSHSGLQVEYVLFEWDLIVAYQELKLIMLCSPQELAIRQGQADHHRWQHSSSPQE